MPRHLPSTWKYSGSALFRHFRRNHQMTQRQLALSLGVTTRHVKYIEAGMKFASPELMQRFKDLAAVHEQESRNARRSHSTSPDWGRSAGSGPPQN